MLSKEGYDNSPLPPPQNLLEIWTTEKKIPSPHKKRISFIDVESLEIKFIIASQIRVTWMTDGQSFLVREKLRFVLILFCWHASLCNAWTYISPFN